MKNQIGSPSCSQFANCSASFSVDHALAEPCSATLQDLSGARAIRRSDSTSEARPDPARPATGSSISCSDRCGGNRRSYSAQPDWIQAGMRCPTAATASFMATTVETSGLSGGRLSRHRRRPEFFQVVESPGLRQHQVDDHVGEIDQYPLCLTVSFDPQRHVTTGLAALY